MDIVKSSFLMLESHFIFEVSRANLAYIWFAGISWSIRLEIL